jgi:uncharacterized protein
MLPRMPHHRVDPAADPTALDDLMAWRTAYHTRLLEPNGWWAVTNLAWVEGPRASLGGAEDDDLRLPARVPARLALVEPIGDGLVLTPRAPGLLTLDAEPLDAPASVEAGGAQLRLVADPDVRVTVVQRGGRWGVRAFDAAQARARASDPVAWFDPDPGWRVSAAVESAGDGATVPIVDVLGEVREVAVAARLRFTLAGHEHTLLAVDAGGRLFVNFRDATNGRETYGAGRFLTADAAVAGSTVLDFHRAHHPPCAHTPHAMCPLPPLANRLPVAVRAGERWPVAAHHGHEAFPGDPGGNGRTGGAS